MQGPPFERHHNVKVFKQQVKWNRLFQCTYSISNRISGISGVAWFSQMFQGVASKSKQTIVFNFHVNQKFKQSKVKSVGYLSKFTQPLKSKWNVENISHRGVPFYLLFKDFRLLLKTKDSRHSSDSSKMTSSQIFWLFWSFLNAIVKDKTP